MATKPGSKLNWVTGDEPSKISEPGSDKKLEGWDPDEKPPFQWFNWLFWIIDKWVNYFEAKTDETATSLSGTQTTLTAVGGTVASHTSTLNTHTGAINTLMSDLDADELLIGDLQTAVATKVAKAGDNMTGELNIAISGTSLAVFTELLRSRATGVISGGAVTVNADPTKIDIAAGVGSVLDQSNPAALSYTAVTWTAKTAVTLTNIGTSRITYVGITSAGAVSQQVTPPTNSERREKVWLAVVHHINNTNVNSIGMNSDFLVGRHNQFRDLAAAIGIINLSGNVLSANGANLKLNRTAGRLFALGAAYPATPKDPNTLAVSSASAFSFTYATQTGGIGSLVSDMVPGSYDVAGTITAIPGANSRATNQRVYLTAESTLAIYYGQAYYNSLADAVAAIASEQITLTENTKNNAVLIGIISLVKNSTALNNSGQAIFTPVSKFGIPIASGSGSGGLAPEPQSSAFSAVTGKRYLIDLTAAVPVQMPQGVPGASVAFFDALGKAQSSVISLLNLATLTPFTGDKWQGMNTDEPLYLDGKYQKIEAYWDTANNCWDWDTNGIAQVQPAGAVQRGTISGEQYYTFTTTMFGPFATFSLDIVISKIGRLVTLNFPDTRKAGNSTAAQVSFGANLPAEFRPMLDSTRFAVGIVNANSQQAAPGCFVVDANGAFGICANFQLGSFSASTGTNGAYPFAVSYLAAP